MDAQAILLKLGWSGPGNPLNPNARPGATSGLGLTRPILVARRKGNSGVGNKTTKDPTNQWWLRGFEDALKGVGEERRTPADARTPNALTSELYRFFVRGEVVAGTLGDKHKDDGEGANGKRKRDADDENDDDHDDKNGKKRKEKKKETKEERKARKEERKKRKEQRRVKREEKKKRKEEREARRADRKLRREKKAAAKLLKRRKEGEEDAPRPQYEGYPTPPMTEHEQEQTDEAGAGVKVKKTKEKKDRKDKKNKEEKETPKESKKRKTREEASTDEAPKKSRKSRAAQ